MDFGFNNSNKLIAKRLKSARLLTGLSRKQFEKITHISANTLRAWETAINPLTTKTALKLIRAFEKCGIFCTADWLLDGDGQSPYLMASGKENISHLVNDRIDDEVSIQREILTFKTCSNNAIVIIITDDKMEPLFSVGDYVGGKDFMEKISFDYLIGENCIIEAEDNNYFVRRMLPTKKKGLYNLIGTNFNSKDQNFVMPFFKIKRAAKVIWHRRKA